MILHHRHCRTWALLVVAFLVLSIALIDSAGELPLVCVLAACGLLAVPAASYHGKTELKLPSALDPLLCGSPCRAPPA